MPNQIEFEFCSTKDLAERLDVSPNWLNHNRSAPNLIPFKKFGRHVRYKSSGVQDWIGTPNLALNFISSKTLAKKLNISPDLLKHNRCSKNPIAFYRLGNFIRYQPNEVVAWLEKNK